MRAKNRVAWACCGLLCCGVPAGGQPEGGGADGGAAPDRTTGTLPELFERIDDAQAVLRAGLRAGLLRQAQRAIGFVVVVDDAPSYLNAISQWEGFVRFPVLWDDGSMEAREHIARFVRAYQPDTVLWLEDDGDWSFGGTREERASSIERALARSLSATQPDWRATLRAMHAQGVVSPGVVLTDPGDAAWAAGLALAAGRLQPIGFMTKPAGVWKPLEPGAADLIEREAERLAKETGRSWDTLGDEIDAVTLAMNTGTQISTGPGARDRLATSDRIGRRERNGSGERWAYCGQIIGDEARGVYQAMSALFLELDRGFVWDGYGGGEPWGRYDGTEAAGVLEERGVSVEVHDMPSNRIDDWQRRMVNPIGIGGDDEGGDAGSALLMLMNTKGASTKFDLDGGVSEEGRPGDLPMLGVPAVLHVVHSFSLQQPMNRRTVGGRLLERGVYAYAGSVDEPFLSGFLPTPMVARRLAAGASFGAAVRYDPSPQGAARGGIDPSRVWKIAVLGDPLVTMGSAGRRVSADVELEGLVDLDERVKARLGERDFAGVLHDLIVLGRDGDAARLAAALMRDQPESFTAEMARMVMPALQRARRFELMVDCYDRLDEAGRSDGIVLDTLWLSSGYLLARGRQDPSLLARVEAMLRVSLREGQQIADAERLAMHLRSRSLDAALGVLESLRPGLSENQRTMLDRAITRVKR